MGHTEQHENSSVPVGACAFNASIWAAKTVAAFTTILDAPSAVAQTSQPFPLP